MKKHAFALSLILLSSVAGQPSPEMSTEECRIKLAGITFTRWVNHAAAHAKA
jgi:hypothetical protein